MSAARRSAPLRAVLAAATLAVGAGGAAAEPAADGAMSSMDMNDAAWFGRAVIDRLEWRHADSVQELAWDAQAWYGGDYDKVWFKAQGQTPAADPDTRRVEALWDRVIARWWNVQTGVRHDFGNGPPRTWLALGLEGLAPGFFELEVTAYLGDAGRTAARLRARRDILLTQRLVLQPELELDAYGRDDRQRRLRAAGAEAQLGLRLRYELRHEVAPYVGLGWFRHWGGGPAASFQALLGLRFWF